MMINPPLGLELAEEKKNAPSLYTRHTLWVERCGLGRRLFYFFLSFDHVYTTGFAWIKVDDFFFAFRFVCASSPSQVVYSRLYMLPLGHTGEEVFTTIVSCRRFVTTTVLPTVAHSRRVHSLADTREIFVAVAALAECDRANAHTYGCGVHTLHS